MRERPSPAIRLKETGMETGLGDRIAVSTAQAHPKISLASRRDSACETFAATGRPIGEQLNEDGRPLFAQAVSAAEKGQRDWTADDLVAVAWVLRRPVQWFFQVEPADQNEMLDFKGHWSVIHAAWAGRLEQERTPDELAAEIARLTKKLQRALQEES